MEDYQRSFINFLLDRKALTISALSETDKVLSSGRRTPWYVNMGNLDNGSGAQALGRFYALALHSQILKSNLGNQSGILYGIPEKGIAIAIETSSALYSSTNIDMPWFFTRKFPKEHGELTHVSSENNKRNLVVGRAPEDGQKIIQVDDVFSTGGTKYNARKMIESLGSFSYPALLIGIDRQEVDEGGNDAIAEYESKTGTKVFSVLQALDIYRWLREAMLPTPGIERMASYIGRYGTEEAKKGLATIVG